MFWVSEYEPKTLDQLNHNPDITEKLYKLSKHEDFPHTIFCGPTGAGKKTRIMALLREIYGESVDNIRIDRRTFKTRSNKPIELKTLQSNHHIEINPSDVGVHDEIVVQEIIKEIAEYRSLNDSFKVVLITEADKLSYKAQHGLRATIEKYSAFCKIIMCVESLSKIIDPILSRCFVIRIRAASNAEMCAIINSVAKKKEIKLNDPQIIVNIVKKSDHNLRRAILLLEVLVEKNITESNNQITVDTPIQVPDWISFIENLSKTILKKQDPKTLLDARSQMYELLSNCIPSTIIFRKLSYNLIQANISESKKRSIIKWSAYYESYCTKGQKDIYFLEAFVAKVLTILIE